MGRFKPAETRFERELRLMRKADEAERNRAWTGAKEEDDDRLAFEAIGFSAAAASVHVRREPHEVMWDGIEAAGEAHHEEPPR